MLDRDETARPVEKPFDKLQANAFKLDKEGAECGGDRDSAGMQKCIKDYTVLWDKQLNDTYKAIMKTSPDDTQKLLKDSEHQWVKFETAETNMAARMKDPVLKMATKEDVIIDRAKELLSYGVGIDNPDTSVNLQEQQGKMQATYQNLMGELEKSPKAQAALKESQDQWTAYMAKEFKLIDRLAPTGNNDPDFDIFNTVLKANIVADRAQELRMIDPKGMR
jgi:uncharacterized protein YecT (DUF1311 family)